MFIATGELSSTPHSFLDRVREQGFRFLIVTMQLVMVMYAIHLFALEDGFGFQTILPLIFGGFIVHAWLPMAWRLPFFVGLTLAAIYILFGWAAGSWLIGIGLGLIGLCHLPIAKWIRVSLIVVASAILIAFRAAWIETSWSPTIITILGSMFMFRLALYLYDMDSEKKKASIWERLAYFFMLPNTVFPFFPIVDYIIFRRSYYNKDAISIYQKGVLWMLRGAIHLILYRLVYYYFTPAVEDVQGLSGVLLFITSAYLLYLRVSGLFHLIIGIMCLFGFNLPETHKHYFLASSFNDYWRRINIYWKDFMMKLFFYPIFMKTRSWGTTNALVFSTLLVFLFTWLLHSYQWFWLQGDFPLTTVDGVYWGVLGVLVAINSVWEAKAGKKKRLTKTWSWKPVLSHTFFVVITFVFLSIMWSFWSSETVDQWWLVMQQASTSTPTVWLWLAAGLAGLYILIVAKEWLEARGIHLFFDETKMSFQEVVGRTSLMAVAVVALGIPQVQSLLGPQPEALLASLQETRLNARDQAQLERGYYESLLANNSVTSGMFGQQGKKPANWVGIYETEAVKLRDDERLWELLPEVDIEFKNARLRTNRWGMRDRDYTMTKSEDAYRVALLGASYVMGAGVENDETFESLLEARLNEELDSTGIRNYELLNFSVGGYGLIQQVTVAQEQVFDFEPDVVLYIAQPGEVRRAVERFLPALLNGHKIHSPFLKDAIKKSGITKDMKRAEAKDRLYAISDDLVEWGYRRIAQLARKNGAVPVLVYLPNTARKFEAEEIEYLEALAQQIGYQTINLEGVYENYTLDALQIAPWDLHPNPKGHQLIADKLYQELQRNSSLLLPDVPVISIQTALN